MSKMEIAAMKHVYKVDDSRGGRSWPKLLLGLAGVLAGLFFAQLHHDVRSARRICEAPNHVKKFQRSTRTRNVATPN